MMKFLYFILAVAIAGCNNAGQKSAPVPSTQPEIEKPVPEAKTYSNERFRNVTVEKTGTNSFLIKGGAQVFEASFGWVIEDGHRELKDGFQMTDAGAPEWGAFSFTVTVEKERENSTLMLILFESSAKDGSRQHELPLVLY